jgi:hypothetical protein
MRVGKFGERLEHPFFTVEILLSPGSYLKEPFQSKGGVSILEAACQDPCSLFHLQLDLLSQTNDDQDQSGP